MNNTFVIRALKGLLLSAPAVLLSLAVIGNVFSYDINFEYIKHIMSMDTTFLHPKLMWRAVSNPIFYHLAYFFLIILELIASIFLWIGVITVFKNLYQSTDKFEHAKQWGRAGLLLALFIYSFLFFTIANEWYSSWQSNIWNAKAIATPFIILFGITYLIFNQGERED